MNRLDFVEYQTEMETLRNIEWEGYTKTLSEIGITYLGNVAQSSKMQHSLLHNFSTYCLYLASADLSGINICPNNSKCKDNCLMGSGMNKVNRLGGKNDLDKSRITKTRLFFANRKVFMQLMLHEIKREKKKAELIGNEFSIRINGTSDLNPLLFKLGNKTLLDMFPNTMFYDYTKVTKHFDILDKYSNYDITFSLDGSKDNEKVAKEYLKKGGRVAVVFGGKLPKKFMGFNVINGDNYDARYKDGNVIVGLKFKKTANNFKNGKFQLPHTDFIIMENDKRCEY